MRLLWEEGLQSCQLQLRGRAGVLSQPRARLWSLTGVGGAVGGEHGAALRAGCFPAFLKQPPKDDKKKKDAGKSAKKDKDPVNKSGGKAKKKKWSKGTVQDKLNNLVLFDTATYD